MALRMTNLGYAYLAPICICIVFRYLGHEMNRIIYWAMMTEGLIYMVTSTILLDTGILFRMTGLEYTETGIPYLAYEVGPFYYVDMVLSMLMLFYGAVVTVMELIRCKDSLERKRISALFYMVFFTVFAYVVNYVILPIDINIMPLTLAIVSVMLIITIERYNVIDVVATARERAFETMPDAVLALDENMNLRDINAAGVRLFPDIAEGQGKPLPEKYAFLFSNPDDLINFKHNGAHFERHFSPVMYKGTLTGYSMVLIDMTHTHQMMLQMRELKKTADIANESKSNFLASMSHEIRTPMNAIVGYADLIAREQTSRAGREYAQSIKSASNSLLHIINDILDFSKIEQGHLEIVEEEYDTDGLFEEVSDIMQVQAAKKGLSLISSVDPTMPSVLYGDKLRIRQVMLNIVGNAIKFTNEGSVRIVTEWEPLGSDRALITITISDTGIGIEKENINKLFEEFERIENKTTVVKPGTGLGLTISKALLEMMGGTIDIESEYGVGTSVIIGIKQKIISNTPIATQREAAGAKEEKKEYIVAPDAKILVVDDNRVNLELMNNYLKQYRIIPDLVESGAEAVKLAGTNFYDIVFMDQMMPEMDGVEAMKRIRALGGRNASELPVIALTANAVAGTRSELISEGFTDYASKPLPIKTLEYLLTKYLPKGTYTLSAELRAAGALDNMTDKLVERKNRFKLPDYIDQRIGMTNSGDDTDQYRSAIEIVHKYGREKVAKIRELLAADDIPAYTIEVHALKSNAATVGAMKLSEKARALEMAGKTSDIDTIRKDSDGFLHEYEQFIKDLGECLENDAAALPAGNIPESYSAESMNADQEEFMQTFDEIEAAIRDSRFDDVKDLFGVLEFFELPPVTTHAVKVMQEASERLDWQTALEIIDRLR